MGKLLYSDYFPIVEYYKRVVQPIKPSAYRLKNDKMMVCPLHDDINPSMGVIRNSNGDEIYHCFGCGRWGNVVDLNMRVKRRLMKVRLSEEESVKDLCKIFGVSPDIALSIEKYEETPSDFEGKVIDKSSEFGVYDFTLMLRDWRKARLGIDGDPGRGGTAERLNSLVIMAIDSENKKNKK